MPNLKWNYQSKDAEIREKWQTQYKEKSLWSKEQRQYSTVSINGGLLSAKDQAAELFQTYRRDLLPQAGTSARKLASAKKILAALDKDQVKDYQLPDENTVSRKRQLQERLAQAHVDSLFSVDVPTEDQLWRYVPEGIEIFQESDEHLMPFLEEEDKARLIDVYRNVDPMKLDRDGRPALLPEGKAVLNELTGKAVDRMMDDLQPLMQKMRSVPGLTDEELVDAYSKFARAGMLVDSLLAHEENGRVNYLSDEQYMQLIAFRRCKDAVDARVELMLSADYPNIDVETLYNKSTKAEDITVESWIYREDAPVALRAMGAYLKAQKSYVNEVPAPTQEQEAVVEDEDVDEDDPFPDGIFPNGKRSKDYTSAHKQAEFVSGTSRLIVVNSLTPREANIRLEEHRRDLLSIPPWYKTEKYEELLKKGLPGFRQITDPREKQERKALREKALERLTVGFQRKSPYLYGPPANGGDRLLMQTLGVLDKEDYERAVRYYRLPTEQQNQQKEELYALYKKGVDKLIENKALLLQLPQENSDQLLKDFADIPHLLMYASACDDLVKTLRSQNVLTEQQVKDINEIENAAVATLVRFSRMIYPQSDIFDFKDPAEMTNREVLETADFLDHDPDLERLTILAHDLSMLSSMMLKKSLIVTAQMKESMETALNAERKTEGGALSFATPGGKYLGDQAAMLALSRGEMVYAYYTEKGTGAGMEVIPLFCPGKDGEGPMLAGDAALAAGRTAYQNRPEPVSPVPEMTAQEDPAPDIWGLSLLLDGIVYFFTSLFGEGRHTDTYQAYEKAWDAWNERDKQRKAWNRKDEEQQEAAQDAYDVEVTGHACVKNGEIPPAVYKKAGVEPSAPRQKRPLPMNFEAKKHELAVKMLDDIVKNEETRYRAGAKLFKQLIEDPNIKSKEKDLLISAIASQQHEIDKAEKAGQQPQPENVQPAKSPKDFVKNICFQAFTKTLHLSDDAAKVQELNKWLKAGNLGKTDLGKEYAKLLQQQAGNNAQQVGNAQQIG